MIWTKEKPTQPGWYWYRGSHSEDRPQVVRIERAELETSYAGGEVSNQLGRLNGEWSGPILEPCNPEVGRCEVCSKEFNMSTNVNGSRRKHRNDRRYCGCACRCQAMRDRRKAALLVGSGI